MPYKAEKIKIEGTEFDRRIKLTDEQRQDIRELHSAGLAQRELARRYRVDRRLISFIVNPAGYEENKKRRAERGGSKVYYEKEKHKNYIKSHRRYKQDLKISNKI